MKSGALAHYQTMTLQDICRLPVDKITEDKAILFMWWVASMPAEALKVVDSWGFKIKTMTGFVWNKTTKHQKPYFGMGFYTRQGSECCLIATKGNFRPVCHSVRSVITEPVTIHSRKPARVRGEILTLCNRISRIELFAREACPGWDCWGDEV